MTGVKRKEYDSQLCEHANSLENDEYDLIPRREHHCEEVRRRLDLRNCAELMDMIQADVCSDEVL